MPEEHRRGAYLVSDDPERLDLEVVHGYLGRSYWSKGISRALVERSIQHSLCFGLYEEGRQVGFARVVTDQATFAYLCDVFILETHRGQGLSKWLMECILAHPDLQGLRRFLLCTRDAQELYRKFGFTAVPDASRVMEINHPGIYLRAGTQ